jgi:AraC-like DNA-binding protein
VSGQHREVELGLDAYQVRLLWVGSAAFSERWGADASDSSTWRLSFRDDGEAGLRYRGEPIRLPTRRPVLIPPEAARGAKPEGDAVHLLLEFQLSGIGEESIEALGSAPLVLAPEELRDRLCARLLRELAGGGRGGSATFARAKAAVHLAVASAFELESDPSPLPLENDATERQLRPVLHYIDAHLDEPLDNTRLAALVHASESHFIRSFRRLIGSTPARHVQERRVQRAADLLARTTLSIDEIAERCGFANRYHFSRVFAQRMAAPPGRYRANHAPRPSFPNA